MKIKIISILGLLVVTNPVFAAKNLNGKVSIDGSSTVFPISEAVAEESRSDAALKNVRVGVNLSGTGGGFKKFCKGEVDITGASRPIKSSEVEMCKAANIGFVELPVAYDGIVVAVNKANACVDNMSVEQLKKIWEPAAEGKITNWKQIDSKCPDMALKLYGPGLDSGTFDYFTEAIVGEPRKSRPDFTKSEDDNVLVTGIKGDEGALGYFGFAYYLESKDAIKAVKIQSGSEGVMPSAESISSGTYTPLSRPIFIYVSTQAAQRPEVKTFADFYIQKAAKLAPAVGYVSLGRDDVTNSRIYSLVQQRLDNLLTGSVFGNLHPGTKVALEDVLQPKKK